MCRSENRKSQSRENTWVEYTSTTAGPMQVKSTGGKEYEYIVVDDYTRAVDTRPLLLKSEVPGAFKVFQAVAENKSQKRMREIMTDNAGELCMGEMKDTCEQEGIKLHMSVWYSPKLNGVAERTIRVLTNAVCHLRDSSLPKSLWAEAFNAATTCIIGCQRRHWAVVRHLRAFAGRNQTFRTCVHSARRVPSLSRQND